MSGRGASGGSSEGDSTARASVTESMQGPAWASSNVLWTMVVSDPDRPACLASPDPGDDYLLALAERERVVLVSGDRDLLELTNQPGIMSPRDFLELLEGPS